MELFNFIPVVAALVFFVYLFIRQDKVDRLKVYRKQLKGDLHVLQEMRKFYVEVGKDKREMDRAIEEIERKLEKANVN